MNLASVYAPILKKERQSDGTLLVTGIATDDTLDIDEQVCDADWLSRAMPEWFKFGNIREQHSNVAAGVATKLEQDGSQHIVTARVVDPASVMKVEMGVLKGFSIGIRDPRIAYDKAAPGGRIVDGQIVEVSLVDRPANPSCLIELAKSVGGTVQQTENLIEKESAAMERCKECGKAFPSADMKEMMCDKCYDMKAATEESSQELNEESSREGGVAGVAGRSMHMSEEVTEEPAVAEESVVEEAAPVEDAPVEEDSEEAETHTLASIAEMLARIEAMLSESKSDKNATEDIRKSVDAIGERVSKVEKSASRGPVRTVVKAVTAPDETAIKAAKAADYRAKAAAVSDPALAQGYLLLAHEAEHSN
jgi:hypothetical protein